MSPASKRNPPILGLTGGIASGKSTVARMLAGMGAEVIDADRIAHEVLQTPEVCRKLRDWPEGVLDAEGKPDRRRIAEVVFNDPQRLKDLSGLVHPETRRRMRERMDRARAEGTSPLIVIDAPLLIEADLDSWCDRVVFVEADAESRRRRAAADRGWSPAEVDRRERMQGDLAGKRRRAHTIVENNGPRERTLAQVERIFEELTRPTLSPGRSQQTRR